MLFLASYYSELQKDLTECYLRNKDLGWGKNATSGSRPMSFIDYCHLDAMD